MVDFPKLHNFKFVAIVTVENVYFLVVFLRVSFECPNHCNIIDQAISKCSYNQFLVTEPTVRVSFAIALMIFNVT